MGRVLLYVSLCGWLATFAACQQETVAPTPAPSSTDLIAEWNWVSSNGGIAGKTLTPTSEGVNIKWVFKADSTFQEYQTRQGNTVLAKSARFSIRPVISIFTGRSERALVLNSSVQPTVYIIGKIDHELVVNENNPDGFSHLYQRR